MRVLVCGSRGWSDYARLENALLEAMPSVIIEGCARGADRMAERFAQENNIPLEHYPADWYRFGPSAGPRRNELMLVRGKPRLVVAFDLGTRGTADMVARARAAGVAVAIVRG